MLFAWVSSAFLHLLVISTQFDLFFLVPRFFGDKETTTALNLEDLLQLLVDLNKEGFHNDYVSFSMLTADSNLKILEISRGWDPLGVMKSLSF